MRQYIGWRVVRNVERDEPRKGRKRLERVNKNELYKRRKNYAENVLIGHEGARDVKGCERRESTEGGRHRSRAQIICR